MKPSSNFNNGDLGNWQIDVADTSGGGSSRRLLALSYRWGPIQADDTVDPNLDHTFNGRFKTLSYNRRQLFVERAVKL